MRALLNQLLYERLHGPRAPSCRVRLTPAATFAEAVARLEHTIAEQNKLLDAWDRLVGAQQRDEHAADHARVLTDGPDWHY